MSYPARFAPIEVLDPEPAQTHARARHWEALLGVVLLLAVGGFAGGAWWDQQATVRHYQAGSRAVNALDWGRAAAEYGAVGAYRDAPQQAARARATLDERARLYGQARAAADGGDWPVVLDALPRLRQIGPTYRDTPQLAAQAAARATAQALSGTVALRATGAAPGLYSYLSDGPHRLPGSDAGSRVRAACPNGDVVYDVAAADGAPGLLGSLSGRRLARVARDGARQTFLAFDAVVYTSYLCTSGGVWGLRPRERGWYPTRAGATAATYSTAFQADGSPRVVAPAQPAPALPAVAIAPDDRMLVLSETVNFTRGLADLDLYLAAPDSRALRPLASFPGALGAAAFSPDGRYVLATVNQSVTPTGNLTQTVLLFDTQTGGPPRTLARLRVAGSTNANAFRFGVDAVFIEEGPWRGRIALNWPVGPRQAIRLIDPARPDAPLLDLQTTQRYGTLRLLAAAPGGGLVLATSRSWERQTAHNGGLVYLDAAGRLHETAVPLPGDFYFWSAWVRAGQIVYVTVGTGVAQGIETTGTIYTISSLPLDPWPAAPARPTPLYTTTVPGASLGWPAARWQAGPGLLAYVAGDGQIHARTYTAAVDVPLDQAATGFSAADSRGALVP